MVNQQLLDKMQTRQSYRNLWHTDLMHTIQADCPFCCLALWCGPCSSYMLRKRALYNDMSRYVCCAGFLPCSGHCGEEKCPEFCLCTEVACIFSLVAAIVGSEEIEAASNILTCASDAVYCTVCACMQTQHKVELDKRDGVFGGSVMQPPQQVVMSRFDQPIPPTVGYPPQYPPGYVPQGPEQPAYGQPYAAYGTTQYPPPTQYPPTHYPPGPPPAGYPPSKY